MDVSTLLLDAKEQARIDGADDDSTLLLMLAAAAADVAHAAGIDLDEAELEPDLRLAIIDQAARLYDLRGAAEGKPGLSVTASRIVARYRGVSLGAA